LALALGGVAAAHTRSTSFATFTVAPGAGGAVHYHGEFAAHDLLGPLPALDRDGDGDVTAPELEAARAAVESYVRAKVWVRDGAVACAAGPLALTIPSGGRDAVADAVFTCAGAPRALVVRAGLFDEPGSEHRSQVNVILASGEARAAILGPADPPFEVAAEPLLRQLGRFLLEGVLHLATGLDHILFLCAVIVAADRLKKLAFVVTAFTAAHSITLILAALSVVALPARLVESAIALSIAYVAVENLFVDGSRWRWAVAFCFGLVHGFGFASVLRQTGLPTRALVPSLLMFNVGVELGQLAVVAVLYPVLVRVRRSAHKRAIIAAGSLVVAAFGAYWFVDRAFSF
jgi:hydrogenase/urease accessory protein HupE